MIEYFTTGKRLPNEVEEKPTYFDRRAPRYDLAMRSIPRARDLDLIPYSVVAAIAKKNRGGGRMQILDAFGGSGFLANSLSPAVGRILVADSSKEMLHRVARSSMCEVQWSGNDFISLLNNQNRNRFDLVFCHGGLHHVFNWGNKKSIDQESSWKRQCRIITTLSKLMRPGGILVIADVPNLDHNLPDQEPNWNINTTDFEKYLIPSAANALCKITARLGHTFTLPRLQEFLDDNYWKDTNFQVPRHFFDQIVAKETPLGHDCCFPSFERIHTQCAEEGLSCIGVTDYRGPWMFDSAKAAGWFFKEKFDWGNTSLLCEESEDIAKCLARIDSHLGTRLSPNGFCVNWGVVYAAYQKPF